MIKILLVIVLCLVTIIPSHIVDGVRDAFKEDLELERQLKLLNKPPVKSIHTKYGYIVDCIDIYKQPAFDHPLLKNHKLQRKPSYQKSNGKASVNDSPVGTLFGLEMEECPMGTVPIKRTTKADLIRSKKTLNDHILTAEVPGLHVAEVYMSESTGPYYGISGTNSIYKPSVNHDQASISNIWVRNGPISTSSKIVVGWHVDPQVNGDDAAYTFSAWSSDNFKSTGCYNIQCPGFVQISPGTYLGLRIDKTSSYGGDSQEFSLSIYLDGSTNNWWLHMGNASIGYFPGVLFSNLTSADNVGWGGRTKSPVGSLSPPMGSGYFPDGIHSHGCYFRQILFQNSLRQGFGPNPDQIHILTDNSNCYGADYYGFQGSDLGFFLQFGGPGGDCGN